MFRKGTNMFKKYLTILALSLALLVLVACAPADTGADEQVSELAAQVAELQEQLEAAQDDARVAELEEQLADVSPEHIRSYLAQRAQSTKPNTAHQAFRVLRTFFKWCINEGLLTDNPMQNIKPPKIPTTVIPSYTIDDIQKLLKKI